MTPILASNPSLSQLNSVQFTTPLSSMKLDAAFVDAFEQLNIDEARNLLEMGANPNQEINLSYPIVLEFIKKHVLSFTEEENKKMDWNVVEKAIQNQVTLEEYANDFFAGQSTMSAINFALILKYDDLAIDLLSKGAEGSFENTNLLQMAVALGSTKVVEYLLLNTQFEIHLAEQTKDYSPFEMALATNAYEIFELMVEHRADQVKQIFEENLVLQEVILSSKSVELEPYKVCLLEKGLIEVLV